MSLGFAAREAQAQKHFNPAIDVLEAKKPLFGLYAPANRRAGRGAPPPADSIKTAAMLAKDAITNKTADFIFDGSMEGNLEAALPAYADYMKGLAAAPFVSKAGGYAHLTHPMFIKTHEIAEDYTKAQANIAKQLNEGASNITFVGVESAEEVTKGLQMMRFKSKGGMRPDDVGNAPSVWGMSDKEYKEKADVWPLNPKGELVNFTIVESKEGLAHIREIAAVKGIGTLFPGAGTLRGVFTNTDASGARVFDEKGWEGAIQQVLAACKEFHVPCGYPATEKDIETRMQQGFSVFIINWGDAGFRAVDIGRKAAGRPATNATNN